MENSYQHGRPAGAKLRRSGKDSVFCDLFSQPDYLLELYRALHPEDISTTIEDLEIVSIEHVMTDGEYNDLGFTVSDRLVMLVESQTAWSVNIVTRMLLYLAETYRRRMRVRHESLHSTALIALPAPELYVVYTGPRDVPDVVTFAQDVLGGECSAVDVSVRVLRGGTDDVVGQYVEFAGVFDDVRRDGSVPLSDKPAEVVRRCVERGILVPYFERRRVEVEDIMFTLFDQERETELYAERVAREARDEGFNQGFSQGRDEGFSQGRNEGLSRGRDEGYSDGIEQGIEQGKMAALAALVDDGLLSLDQAAARLGVIPERFLEMRAQATRDVR